MTKKPNHAADVAAMARLSDWQPDHLAGYRVGDFADLPKLGRVEIVGLHAPALLEVRTSTGARCRVGWRAVRKTQP